MLKLYKALGGKQKREAIHMTSLFYIELSLLILLRYRV